MEKIKYANDKVVLFQRRKSPIWQARMKIGKGVNGWKRFSTGCIDIDEAGKIACERFIRHQMKVELGLSPDSRTFKHCAKIAEKEMRTTLDSGSGKVIYEDYIRTLHKYLIPFFGRRIIDTIDYGLLVDFDEYRIKKLGRVPSRSTVANHNATLHRVFNVAVRNKWMKQESIPSLKNEGRKIGKQEVRPYFNDDELKKLLKFLKKFRGTGRKEITQQIRTLLYDYVVLIAYTGIRPGTEADYIKFSDIGYFTNKNGKKYLTIRVCGKTGERVVVADKKVKRSIENIIGRHHGLDPDESVSPFDNNVYIFELESTGKLPKDLGRAFKKALEGCGLLYNKHGKVRTLYSLRHSFASRIIINNETNIHMLARHMGTSVALIEKHYSHFTSLHKAERLTLTGSFEDNIDLNSSRDEVVKYLKSISKNASPKQKTLIKRFFEKLLPPN